MAFDYNIQMCKKIVVTDDDPGLQDIFKIILERAGYEVEVVPNGKRILQNQYSTPDLFILDKQLSGFDGLDICRFLKKQESTAHIPVIMISANPSISTMAKDAGADDYIEKPFDMTRLLKMVEDYISV